MPSPLGLPTQGAFFTQDHAMNPLDNDAGPDNATQVKVWIREDVLTWIDQEAVMQGRSRAWIINHALRDRMTRVERDRARRRKRVVPGE